MISNYHNDNDDDDHCRIYKMWARLIQIWTRGPDPYSLSLFSERPSVGTRGSKFVGCFLPKQSDHHHRCVACPVLDVAVPMSVLQT